MTFDPPTERPALAAGETEAQSPRLAAPHAASDLGYGPTDATVGDRVPLRADAARNVRRIIAAAAEVLADDPQLGMAKVAEAAGVSRATLYRHFETRDSLLDAVGEQAIEEARRAVTSLRLADGPAPEALERLLAVWLDLWLRYSLPQLSAHSQLGSTARTGEIHDAARRALREPIIAVVERGQAAGEFAADLTPDWVARTFGALMVSATRAVRDGVVEREDAAALAYRTLIGGLRP